MKVLGSFLLLSLLFLVALNCNASAEDHSAPAQGKEEVTPARSGGPARIRLEVRETAGVARQGEVLRSGLPLPRSLGARDPKGLAVVDAKGALVPAQFEILARWNAGLADTKAPIQWLLVHFPATVEPGGQAVYWLVTDGSAGTNPPPPRPLKLVREGQGVAVDTGAAVFHVGGSEALFSEIRLATASAGASGNGRRLVTGGEMSVQTGGRSAAHSEIRKVWIEHSGPLSATVVVDGAYGLPPVGDGGLGSRRRYVFTGGSPTVLVRHAIAWEGNLGCQGCIRTKDGQPNALRFERVRDTLRLAPEAFGSAVSVTAVGARDKPAVEGRGPLEGGGELARVRQTLRARRQDPLAFDVEVAGRQARGEWADGGLLTVAGPGGALAVALNHMHRYEPQALRLLGSNGTMRMAIDLADDKVWVAHHQGLFASLAVAALPAAPERADLDRLVWAPLNRPLRAWPDAAWFANSQAVEEIPTGPLPREVSSYDRVVPDVLKLTGERIDSEGLPGLMTFGVLPRYWGRWDGGELQCKKDKKKNQKKGDPTPDETWDDTFWCSTWTDYHNTLATAPLWAMRSGEVEWLDELAFPGALRTLHTQIMQCGPGERWFYCGQAPAGYAAYRSDFNSSHAYFDNLLLYYWLTGDGTVVDTLRRGGENMRRLMCPRRGGQPVTAAVDGPEGAACVAGEPLTKSSFSGRVGIQWLTVFRFLGLASPDASFLEDYKSGLGRMLTHQYAELTKDGKTYGFLGGVVGARGQGLPQRQDDEEQEADEEGTGKKGKKGKKGKPRKAEGQYEAGPLWMNAFYDAELLERWMLDSGDEPLGDPPLRPSRVLTAVAHTLVDLDARYHDKKGAVRSPWPQNLLYSFEGPRIGGRLLAVESDGRELFNPEKAGMAALLVRVGQRTGDREILRAGEEMVDYVLDAAQGEKVPLGKLQGQYLARLHGAVGRLAAPSVSAASPSLPRAAGEGAPSPPE